MGWLRRIFFLSGMLFIVCGVSLRLVDRLYYGPGALSVSKDVVIPAGGVARIGATLRRRGVIRYPVLFELAAWVTRGERPLHAGEFRFISHGSMRSVLETLRDGRPVEHQIMIPPGVTATQIAAIINNAPAARGRVVAPPEGSVLPQTYDYLYGTERSVILLRMQRAMKRALASAWADRVPNLPFSDKRQALILASIVQLETPRLADLPKIAGVYENRLVKGMKLQADPTVIFAVTGGTSTALAHRVDSRDLAVRSPYNTYLHVGLPPGPISAPGLAAIHAVLHPARTDALYFVATPNGGDAFARNFARQRANVARYWRRKEVGARP